MGTRYLTVSDLSKPTTTPLQAQLEKAYSRFQNEAEFCKHHWGIDRARRNELIEYAELLMELKRLPWRPASEGVCRVLASWSAKYQASSLQQIAVTLSMWNRILETWRTFRSLKEGDRIDVENITPEFVHTVLANLEQAHQEQKQRQQPQPPSAQTPLNYAPQRPQPATRIPTPIQGGGSNSSSVATASSSSALSSDRPSKKIIENLIHDPRRFHTPPAVVARIHQFFNGPPQLDPAFFEGSALGSSISIPFPDIMDCASWRRPAMINGVQGLAAIDSCFLHVPIVPSKRTIETDTEVIVLDDVRLSGQMNARLWEEFSGGNVIEAISIIPASATWFPKTELADWPCVVMSGLKFEQANQEDLTLKKYSEIHSYIAVYLGRDPLRQLEFVKLFSDLAVSPGPPSMGGQQRWLAGFRRLSRAQGGQSDNVAASGSVIHTNVENFGGNEEEDGSLDPVLDDIYSIRPPSKKPRLERVGRPSDARAAWHHSKRRKMDNLEFSKLQDHNTLDNTTWGSDAEMSE
ncbi:hypothetical protein BGZ94_007473 [Podila epigama]|nr:hypothetical protein BGZ94_007473 [Podila epigama]